MYTQAMLILILANVQYSQEAVFSFEKGSNGQNHSSSKVCTGGGGGGGGGIEPFSRMFT